MKILVRIYNPPEKKITKENAGSQQNSAAQNTTDKKQNNCKNPFFCFASLKPLASYGTKPQQKKEIVSELQSNVKNEIQENGSPSQKYNNGIFIEQYSNDSDLEKDSHFLINLSTSTSLFGNGGATINVVVNTLYSNTIAVKCGDIAEVMIDKKIYYIGYVSSISEVGDGNNVEYTINIDQFKNRLFDIGFLANLSDSGFDIKQQTRLNRQIANLIAICRVNTYLELVPIYCDMNDKSFFSFYQVGDTIGETLAKLSNIFLRLFFQRRNGAVYITQLIGSDAITKHFNVVDIENIQNIYSSSETVNYTNLPAKLTITYNNDLIVAKGYINAVCTPNFPEYPNAGTLFSNTVAVTWNMPSTFSVTNVIAYEQIVKISSMGLFKYEINFPEDNSVQYNNLSQARTFSLLQVLRYMYNELRKTVTRTIRMPAYENTIIFDIGDTIKIKDELYTVYECNCSLGGKDAAVTLQLMPTKYTNPVVTLSKAESTYRTISRSFGHPVE